MRTFFSYVGLILLAIGLIFLGGDMMTSLEQGQITWHSFQGIWTLFDAGAVNAFVAWLNRTTPHVVAVGVLAVLAVPAMATGFVGVLIAFLAGHQGKSE